MTTHGGKRPGSGRPRKPEAERLIKRCIAMSRDEWASFDRTADGRTYRGAILELLTFCNQPERK